MPRIIEIELVRENRLFQAYFGFSSESCILLYELKTQFLSNYELDILQKLQHINRIHKYIQGRYITKLTLAKYYGETDLKSIIIKTGIFNQPLINHPKINQMMVSISHTSNLSACLVSSSEHPMALDIETIHLNNKSNIKSQLTENEIELISTRGEESHILYTILWTVKEAISKVLGTGLTVPLTIFEIEKIEKIDTYFQCTFINFGQFKTRSYIWQDKVFSFVLPQKTQLIFKEFVF